MTSAFRTLSLGAALCSAAACASTMSSSGGGGMSTAAPSPDPRVGLRGGLMDAGQAAWNLRLLSATPPSKQFLGAVNSDLAFTGPYVIQGSYDGYQIWDITNPASPSLKVANYCPASQSDVSVYRNLLFVSAEGNTGRIDCSDKGVKDPVSTERIKGVRIFDVTDIAHPRNVANVQTCRGSHTHTVLVDPNDHDNVYVYVSGSSGIRPAAELPGCVSAMPEKDPNSALFRIEVIKVPLAHPEQAAIVSSPRIFNDLTAPARHGSSAVDRQVAAAARARGEFVADVFGESMILPAGFTGPLLDSVVKARKGSGPPTRADSAALRAALPGMIAKMVGEDGPPHGPTQCHDITVYPAVGLAGGACEGYGLLLDIRNPTNPVRIGAVADSNFSYWHSATFNNDGTKVLFSDEWGGGGQPKCRASDPKDWGADALFTIDANRQMHFQSYYKMPAAQTALENCVAHNGSLIPIPGRDVMVQAWYQGGISVFDWTDAAHPKEIAFFDRGPVDSTQFTMGGSWSVYWYNGAIVSSEIARGLDVFELTPSAFVSQNEIDAAKSVHLDYLNTQGQPQYVWAPSFVLARAYVDQLARSNALGASRVAAVRQSLASAEAASGAVRRDALTQLAVQLDGDARGADAQKVRILAGTVRDLAAASR
ncbi:MAG: repeat-containing protein [Gemmatimonadetes bacterium]|nr:repeat-containing protein [Gemmatimonadota bacterium]